MGNEPGEQANVVHCEDCGQRLRDGQGHTAECLAHVRDHYAKSERPLIDPAPEFWTTKPYCACGATTGVKEKPHAKGCPNSPEEQRRNLREFVAKNKPGPSEPVAWVGCRHCGEEDGHASDCPRFGATPPELERFRKEGRDRLIRESEEREKVEAETKFAGSTMGIGPDPCPECKHSSDEEWMTWRPRKHWIGCSRITPEQPGACPSCGRDDVHHDDCPLRDGVKLKAQAAREHLEHAAADAFWAYWNKSGASREHGYYESTWSAIRAAIAAAPSFFRAATDCCPDCGAEWDPGAEEQHKKGCERAHAPSSWRTCPCGKPTSPGGDTRTNVYRGDELIEVRYPHEDGVQCCWTREKRR